MMLNEDKEALILRLEEETKNHVLAEEVNNTFVKSYIFKEPKSSVYWMRAIQTNYGLHLEGDCGCLQLCGNTFEWLAATNSTDYPMTKLTRDYRDQQVIQPYLVKPLVARMIAYRKEGRDFRRNFGGKLLLFSPEERDFFEELRDNEYDPGWTLEEFYNRIVELPEFTDFLDGHLQITDFSWSVYWRFFCLRKVAREICKKYRPTPIEEAE